MAKSKPSRGRDKPQKQAAKRTLKSFKDLHGSSSPVAPVTGEQLGHDQQLPVNPPVPRGSPLINPNEPGHPMELSRLGQSMDYESGPDFY